MPNQTSEFIVRVTQVDNEPDPDPMVRLTIDVPVSLHTRIKIECARRGYPMAEILRALLEQEFLNDRHPRS